MKDINKRKFERTFKKKNRKTLVVEYYLCVFVPSPCAGKMLFER